MKKDFRYFTNKKRRAKERGPQRTDFLAKLSTDPELDKHFNGSQDTVQVKNLTRGKNYRIHAVTVLDGDAGVNFMLFDDTGREQVLGEWVFAEPDAIGQIITITAVRRDGFRCDTLSMEFAVLDPDRNFDLRTAITQACQEYITQTKTGYETYTYGNGDFNWADFWTEVPNAICEKHGFRKITDSRSLPDVDWDETLYDVLAVTEDQKDAIVNYLIDGGVEACVNYLEGLLSPNIPPFTDPEDFRDILRQAMTDYADDDELLDFYMANVAEDIGDAE